MIPEIGLLQLEYHPLVGIMSKVPVAHPEQFPVQDIEKDHLISVVMNTGVRRADQAGFDPFQKIHSIIKIKYSRRICIRVETKKIGTGSVYNTPGTKGLEILLGINLSFLKL